MATGIPRQHAGRAQRCVSRRPRFWALMLAPAVVLTPGRGAAQLAVARVEVVMQPGDMPDAAIGVRNESDKPVQALVRLEDWDRASDGANRWYPYGSQAGNGSCAPALSIFPQSMRLEPGAEQAIRVVLDRDKAPAGECWAAAVVETVQQSERAGQRVAWVVRTAVKIYVQPSGLRAGGEIEGLRVAADGTSHDSTASVVEVLFSNTGTRHLVTEGALEVRRADNTVVTRVTLPAVYALPGAHHVVRVPMPKLESGSYVLLATMDYGGADIAAALLEHRAR